MSAKKEKILSARKQVLPCRPPWSGSRIDKPGEPPRHYDAFPRDCKSAYMTPTAFTPGFRILQLEKTEVDFSEMRSLMFLEDSSQATKWGVLKNRIPYPETRVTDLPGTRETHYYNYCLRKLTPESASSWRRSIIKTNYEEHCYEEEEENKKEKEEIEEVVEENENAIVCENENDVKM